MSKFNPDWDNYRTGYADGLSDGVPEGFILVPIEPTEKVIDAMATECRNDEQCRNNWDAKSCKYCRAACMDEYQAITDSVVK